MIREIIGQYKPLYQLRNQITAPADLCQQYSVITLQKAMRVRHPWTHPHRSTTEKLSLIVQSVHPFSYKYTLAIDYIETWLQVVHIKDTASLKVIDHGIIAQCLQILYTIYNGNGNLTSSGKTASLGCDNCRTGSLYQPQKVILSTREHGDTEGLDSEVFCSVEKYK